MKLPLELIKDYVINKKKIKKIIKIENNNHNVDNLVVERHAHICEFSVISERSIE